MKIVLATGGFDPLHSGHIAYFTEARKMGDMLIVGLNSDTWLQRKKGRAFMPLEERAAIVSSLKVVDDIVTYDDRDNSSIDAIKKVLAAHPDAEVVFVNGGDRTAKNIPEMAITDSRLHFRFGVGGNDKMNSSSWILEEWKAPKTKRDWGYYRVLHTEGNTAKVKELIVDPGRALSMQRHSDRAEHWFVAEGIATVLTLEESSSDIEEVGQFIKNEYIHINRNQWHQLVNETKEPLKVVEIQYGDRCDEDDIVRLN